MSTRTRTIAAVAASLGIVAASATGAALTSTPSIEASTSDGGACMMLRWDDALAVAHGDEQAAQSRWDGMIQAGWYGSPDDGMEAVWSPSCTDDMIAQYAPTYRSLAVYPR